MKKRDVERIFSLPKAPQVVTKIAEIQAKFVWLQSLFSEV